LRNFKEDFLALFENFEKFGFLEKKVNLILRGEGRIWEFVLRRENGKIVKNYVFVVLRRLIEIHNWFMEGRSGEVRIDEINDEADLIKLGENEFELLCEKFNEIQVIEENAAKKEIEEIEQKAKELVFGKFRKIKELDEIPKWQFFYFFDDGIRFDTEIFEVLEENEIFGDVEILPSMQKKLSFLSFKRLSQIEVFIAKSLFQNFSQKTIIDNFYPINFGTLSSKIFDDIAVLASINTTNVVSFLKKIQIFKGKILIENFCNPDWASSALLSSKMMTMTVDKIENDVRFLMLRKRIKNQNLIKNSKICQNLNNFLNTLYPFLLGNQPQTKNTKNQFLHKALKIPNNIQKLFLTFRTNDIWGLVLTIEDILKQRKKLVTRKTRRYKYH
jgi:hypothetical protein